MIEEWLLNHSSMSSTPGAEAIENPVLEDKDQDRVSFFGDDLERCFKRLFKFGPSSGSPTAP